MANLRPPEYGVKKDELTLTSQDPAAVLYGVTPDNKFIPIKTTDDGELIIGSTITLEMSDMQIGAVEVKDGTTDNRLTVTPAGEAVAQARLYDSAGVAFTATDVGPSHALDINVVGGTTISASTDEDDSVPAGMQLATLINLTYGYDGIDWQRINSTGGRLHVDGSGVTQPISAASLPLPTGAATEATLASVETNTDNLDVLLSTRATEATLAGIKAQTDLFSFTGSALNVNIASGVTLEVNLDNANDDVLVYGQDSGAVNRALRTNTSGQLEVSVVDSVLPTGAATEASLSGFRTDFNAVDFATEATLALVESQTAQLTFAATRLLVDGSGVTQPISAVALPLPTGAATEATLLSVETNTDNLDVALSTRATEATLSTLNSKFVDGNDIGDITINNTAGAGAVNIQDGGNSITVDGTLAVTQSGTWNINNISGTISLPTGASTEATLSTLNGKIPSGLTVTSTRLLVDGSGVTQPVSGTVAATQSGNWSVRLQDGAGTALTSTLVNTRQALDIHQADTSFIISGLTAVGNAPSLNPVSVSGIDGGGLKRHLLTNTAGELQVGVAAWLGSTAPTVGQKTAAASIPVTIASDQTPIASTTATLSNVASSATSVTLLSANTARRGASIHNDSNQILYVKFGTTASSSSYTVRMVPQAHYEVPFGYNGRIDGIWVSANGNARVTELT